MLDGIAFDIETVANIFERAFADPEAFVALCDSVRDWIAVADEWAEDNKEDQT